MGLLKKKDKKKSGTFESRLKGGGGGSGSQLSALRPVYVESLPPCTGNCPSGNNIRGWLTVIQLREKLGLSLDEALRTGLPDRDGDQSLPIRHGSGLPASV